MTEKAPPHQSDQSPDTLTPFIRRNIENLRRRHKRELQDTSRDEKIADAISRLSGSMMFVYIHAALVIIWVIWNTGTMASLRPFDPTFVILATVASVEAIFLSTFVLISQNRVALQTSRRDELELHMTLLAERETTRLLSLVLAIARKLEIEDARDPELDELQKTVEPDQILDHIEVSQHNPDDSPG